MSGKINKNDKEYPLGFMPEHYPADRVYLDGDTSKTVQDAMIKHTEITYTIEALPAGGYKNLGDIPYQSCIGCVAKEAINIDGPFSVSITNGDAYINVVKAQSGTGALTVSFLYT